MDPTSHPDDGRSEAENCPLARPTLNRRALLRAGAGASPVLLTLVSRPVAATTTCTVASSFVSVSTWRSRNPGATTPQCTTRTCENWVADARLPATGVPSRPSYLNNNVAWLMNTTTGSTYDTAVLWELLDNKGAGVVTSGELGMLQHLVCLALNAKSATYMPYPGGVSPAYVGSVWSNYKSNGGRYMLNSSGINWDSNQVITWARMLMYVSV